MLSVNIFTATEARAQLSKLLDLVATGEEVIIFHKESGQKFIITLFKSKLSPKRNRKHIG
jgi:antitoxin (DNA-binding transcriptional repressor) of toxin-antitoxin stability system